MRPTRIPGLGILLLLLAGGAAPAGEVDDAVKEFRKDFAPGTTTAARENALAELAEVADEEVLEAFEWALETTVREVRRCIFEKDDAREDLKDVERQRDDIQRRAVERARKDGRPPPTSIPVPPGLARERERLRSLVERLQRRIDDEYELRASAATALGGWLCRLEGDHRRKAFRELERRGLSDHDWAVRVFYANSLAACPSPAATRLLLLRLGEEKDERVLPVVIDAVAEQCGEEAVPDLLVPLADERWQIRVAAVAALGRIGAPAAVPPLIDRLRIEEGRLRGDIAKALEAITGQKLGISPDRWQRWWDENRRKPGPAPEAPDAEPPQRPADRGGVPSFYGIRVVSKRIIFVIDVSGSMNQPASGRDENRTKIDVAKYELKNALLSLPEDAEFNIVFYHTEVSLWRKGMVDAEGRRKRDAVEFIDGMAADGATNIFDALKRSFHLVGEGAHDENYEVGADTIFFLSDGQPNRGDVVDPTSIANEVQRWNRLRRVKVHAVGVGPGHNGTFMKRLADDSGGTYVRR